MKSILKYPGSKWRIAKWIVSHFTDHKIYVEPFFGSGAVFFNKEPSGIEVINDLDGEIVNLFKACRDYPDALAALIKYTPIARDEFVRCCERKCSVSSCVEEARRTLVKYWQNYQMSRSRTWKVSQTAGSGDYSKNWNELPERITVVAKRLKNAQIENSDALDIIKRFNNEDVLMFLDPPYLAELCSGKDYDNSFSDLKHKELLGLIKTSKSKVIVSSYENDLYNEELKDWSTNQKSTSNRTGKLRVEKIYYNYNINKTLFDLM